jgi:ABC-type oligopeptide transport system substrate-binding subunit
MKSAPSAIMTADGSPMHGRPARARLQRGIGLPDESMPDLRHASSIAALAALLVILGISAAGSAAAATLRRGIVETIDTLDPRGSTTPEARLIARDLFEGLVTLDAQRRPVPGAARSWELSEDGRTYLFRLRPDARWSNGEPVRAEAFVHAFRRAATNRDPKVRSLLRHVANASAVASGQAPPEALGVDAPDDGTLRLRLDIRQPSILAALADVALSPVHSGQSRDGGTDPPVTNGPYRVASWEPGKRLVLERNRWHRDALTGAADEVTTSLWAERPAASTPFGAASSTSSPSPMGTSPGRRRTRPTSCTVPTF